jgi:hypothetical protein
MLKKVLFAAALTMAFVTSFHFGRDGILPSKASVVPTAGACECNCGESWCRDFYPGCCG